MECLVEIGSLNVGNLHDQHFEKLYVQVMPIIRGILPSESGMYTTQSVSSFV